MICVPACAVCTGLCKQIETRAATRHKSAQRAQENTPNSKKLMYMPCGCLALPVEIVRVFGGNMQSFHCDEHGVQKVTKGWLKKAEKMIPGLGPVKHVPSEFGYQVMTDDDSSS